MKVTLRSGVVRVVALTCAVTMLGSTARPGAFQGSAVEARHRPYDELLDLNVRDGMVYYRALKAQRARLDSYIAGLAGAPLASASRDEQIAFWLNAYNAIVLQTVINYYPITQQRSRDYPTQSIRQIPGAFEKTSHRVAGQSLTLDQIEQAVLPGFQDARVFLALGRGALGGGRLHSEAYSAAKLEEQLAKVARECASRVHCVDVDRTQSIVKVTPVFSWREKEFSAAYAGKAPAVFASRSPIERAVIAFIAPNLLFMEREFTERNAFKMEFMAFDWTLNDLTGRGGR